MILVELSHDSGKYFRNVKVLVTDKITIPIFKHIHKISHGAITTEQPVKIVQPRLS